MIDLVLLIACFLSIASIIFCVYSKAGNQILIPVIWWFMWSVIGLYYPLGYFNVLTPISVLIASAPLFLCLGYFFSKTYFCKKIKNLVLDINRVEKINFASIFFTAPFLIWLLWNFVDLISSGSSELIRQLVYSEDTPYYGGKFIEYISSQFIKPFGVALLWFGVLIAVNNNSYRVFAHGAVFMLIVSIVEMGRFGIYMSLLGLVLIYFNSAADDFRKSIKLLLFFLVSLLLLVSYLRSFDLDDFYSNIINTYIVRYHTLFVGLLNYEYLSESLLHDRTYGLSSVFSFINPLIVILKFLSFWDFVPIDGVVGADLDFVRTIGYWNNDPIFANAYVSIIYGLYKDFYFFGPPIFYFLMGIFLRRRIIFNPAAIPIIYLLFFGIFQQSLNFAFYSSLFYYWGMLKFSSKK